SSDLDARIGARIVDVHRGGLIDHLADVRVVVVSDLLKVVEHLSSLGDGDGGDVRLESADAPIPGTCAADDQAGLVVQGAAAGKIDDGRDSHDYSPYRLRLTRWN